MFGDGPKLNVPANNIISMHHKQDEALVCNPSVEPTIKDIINREKYAISLIDAITTWPYKN